jgi:hypothetical protein
MNGQYEPPGPSGPVGSGESRIARVGRLLWPVKAPIRGGRLESKPKSLTNERRRRVLVALFAGQAVGSRLDVGNY